MTENLRKNCGSKIPFFPQCTQRNHTQKFLWNRLDRKHVDLTEKYSFFWKTHSTVWKLRKFSLTYFWQKFRQSNGFTKEITKELIWRNISLARENFSFFHTVKQWKSTIKRDYIQKFPSNQLFRTNVDLTGKCSFFCKISDRDFDNVSTLCEREFLIFPHCIMSS